MIDINIDKIAQEVISGLKATMAQKKRNATGKSSASLRYEFDESTMTISILGDDHWQYINAGRRRGEKPPYARILEWCVAKGIPKQAAWAIRTNIGKYGAPRKKGATSIDQGKLNVVEDTMEAVEPFILKELDKQAKASFEATIGRQWRFQ